ncbi:MAG TPA: methyltransferase domain-containing protein [Candidatus Magasanikbacteria bacterium]|nr:methyltransferase domain-containing protein [Candidatus Magasanikbacteria bacterium]
MAKIKLLNSTVGYDLAAEVYDRKEKYLDSFEKNKLIAKLGDVSGKKILDAGAGTGRIALKLANLGADVTALDVSREMLCVLKNKTKKSIETVVGDAENMLFADESFDIVVAAFLIVHFNNPKYFFQEVYRVLKPGGVLIVSNINQRKPPEVETRTGKIVIESYYHRPESIIQELEDLAFSINEEFVKENGVWVNQIIKAEK